MTQLSNERIKALITLQLASEECPTTDLIGSNTIRFGKDNGRCFSY